MQRAGPSEGLEIRMGLELVEELTTLVFNITWWILFLFPLCRSNISSPSFHCFIWSSKAFFDVKV